MRVDDISQLVEPTLRHLGFELWGCEYFPNQKDPLLRFYIDSESGVTVDDCATASDAIGALLDVEDCIEHRYVLEVSSPGIDRRLFKLEHYSRYLGESVTIKLQRSLDNRRNFKGTLEKVEGSVITVKVDNDSFDIQYSDIQKAKVLMYESLTTN